MQPPDRFSDLPAYAFPRLRELLDVHDPGGAPLAMSIGEPKHAFPPWVMDVIAEHAEGFGRYPPNDGTPELRTAFCGWLKRRYGVARDPDAEVLPLNGTREGLYNVAMALCPESRNGERPVVLTPNPFYQVYAVAAMSVAADPIYVNATAETGFLPDISALSDDVLDRTALVYLCSPANPQGAVADRAYWAELLDLAERHDFIVLADECYSDVWRTEAPPGVLEVAAETGTDPERVVAFHSLSKRSNLPGLRSGFATSGPQNIARMKSLRNYAGAPLPLPLQRAAERLWDDEDHVAESRALYRAKFDLADRLLGSAVPDYRPPEAGFFLWLPVPDGEAAALKLWRETGVRVLPGAFLARDTATGNPGHGYIRVALVAPYDDTDRGLRLLRDCLYPEGLS
ncbi:MAG: aminotransferase class I/II-fold pyridoxal phosphate-dependent enzyme [Rhodobacteraceae bacterium]|nr:aminotransferase class I/II-fold pyridoxal phosphate-dependent enzyme [Paracoccaceae bacterium]